MIENLRSINIFCIRLQNEIHITEYHPFDLIWIDRYYTENLKKA
jgi:hypothetical protein